MSGEKQIEEIKKVLNECCNRYDAQGNHIGNKCYECEEWSDNNYCCCSYNTKEATALYNAGYRKASEVARKIFEDIERTTRAALILLKFQRDEDIRTIKIECYADILGYIAELKKKYTEE